MKQILICKYISIIYLWPTNILIISTWPTQWNQLWIPSFTVTCFSEQCSNLGKSVGTHYCHQLKSSSSPLVQCYQDHVVRTYATSLNIVWRGKGRDIVVIKAWPPCTKKYKFQHSNFARQWHNKEENWLKCPNTFLPRF